MTIDELRASRGATPFQPFEVQLADGRTYPVEHPERLAIYPSGRRIAVAGNDAVQIIDVPLIVRLEHRPEGHRRKGRS